MAVDLSFTVRWSDCDAMAHVNNAVYFSYFEMGRIEWFAHFEAHRRGDPSLATARPMRPSEFPLSVIIAELRCSFRSPALFNERLKITVRLGSIGRTSYGYDYLIISEHDGRTIAEGKSTQVLFDYRTNAPTPIDEKLRGELRAFDPLPGLPES